jgi:hypothetical protein
VSERVLSHAERLHQAAGRCHTFIAAGPASGDTKFNLVSPAGVSGALWCGQGLGWIYTMVGFRVLL